MVVLLDVNVLLYAHREEIPEHPAYRDWLEDLIHESPGLRPDRPRAVQLSPHRHPQPQSSIRPARWTRPLSFADQIRDRPNRVAIAPGARHWEIFTQLCRQVQCKGNLVQDAYLAALAIESGSEWITTDRDFTRFPDLRWRHPLA